MNLNEVCDIVTGLMVEGLLFYCNAKFEEFHLKHRYFCPGTVIMLASHMCSSIFIQSVIWDVFVEFVTSGSRTLYRSVDLARLDLSALPLPTISS